MLPCTGLVHHVPHSASGDNCMRRLVLSALCLSFAGVPGLLAAQGFGIYEQGTCSMGRAGTGVAAPCADGSALFFNPAGLAGLQGGHATIGVTLINVDGGFTDDIFQRTSHLQDPLIALPQVYVSYAATPKLGIGVGLFAPYGLQTEWPLSFDGRFAGYKNIIRSVYIQPTVAYQVTLWLSLGGGLDIGRGSLELNQHHSLADPGRNADRVHAGVTSTQPLQHGADSPDGDHHDHQTGASNLRIGLRSQSGLDGIPRLPVHALRQTILGGEHQLRQPAAQPH